MNKPTRLRYIASEDKSKLVSKGSFLGNGGVLLTIEIDVSTQTVSVLEGGSIVAANQCKSISQCKTKAKKMLMTYGVTFYEEIRKRAAIKE